MMKHRWYSRFGVEPPFPWLLAGLWAVCLGVLAAPVVAYVAVSLIDGDPTFGH